MAIASNVMVRHTSLLRVTLIEASGISGLAELDQSPSSSLKKLRKSFLARCPVADELELKAKQVERLSSLGNHIAVLKRTPGHISYTAFPESGYCSYLIASARKCFSLCPTKPRK